MNCNPCEGQGFKNLHQVPDKEHEGALASNDYHDAMLKWIEENEEHDVCVCDCCGDGDGWYGEPGDHTSSDFGRGGPYAYNGGLPECA